MHDGEILETTSTSSLVRCHEDFFDETEFERNYYKNKKDEFMYCMNDHDDELYLLGTRNSIYLEENTSYIVVEV